ncbi:NAD-dependent epimerase/dehydratase family protein [Paenibacillus nasutitermitis]|uniref:UDP-glucose 4-epimerase n=1 Tax=Paenibacillus nasutitermitis TaxID=1652958 RepID=A0A916YLW1_9BACL|nr:NAD-dependent epimerase/dehydratase family protein [Paenibacillus nasutitermitis]GGD50010.1 UDP-glucose 4-epimerase [Paenibacillus nasutitermitis]
MKIVITGGAGFIGSRLAAALIDEGHEVLVLDDLSSCPPGAIPVNARFKQISVCDSDIPRLIEQELPGAVFHLAAQADISRSLIDPVADLTTNVIGTLQVLDGCRRVHGCKIIFISTAAVFGDLNPFILTEEMSVKPATPYALSKRIAERYTEWFYRIHGVPFTILRLSNVYGAGQKPGGEGGVIAFFMEQLRLGEPLVIHGDGSQVRDFIHVKDVVHACMLALGKGNQETLHIGSGVPWSIIDLVRELAAIRGGAPPETIYAEKRSVDSLRSLFNPDKASLVLGWKPGIRFAEGLRATYEDELGAAGVSFIDSEDGTKDTDEDLTLP